MSRHKIIIAIDYGTTYTGISYVTSDKSGLDDITIIQSWPGPGKPIEGSWKVPTRIAYASENRALSLKEDKWGYEVQSSMLSCSWTKLLLDKSASTTEFDDPSLISFVGQGLMRLPSGRDAQTVCQDFLSQVYKFVIAKLEKQYTAETIAISPLECWFTMPAIWSDQAQNATKSAALGAGFGSRPLDALFMITEPEAAAIAALKEETSESSLNPVLPGEDVLVCDCGGGTVDITTYSIVATQPVIDFEELLVGVGGKCGATYIDRNLHQMMALRFGKAFTDLPPKRKGPTSPFMESFERVKRDFGYSQNDEDEVKRIGPLAMKIPESKFYDPEEDMINITKKDLMELFNPVMEQIIGLVSQQVAAAKKKNHNIDRIILVGGFGDSPYLNAVLKKWCVKNGGIRLMCPQYCQAAIARGAALRGLEGTAPGSKQCRRHYGMPICKPFREGIDDDENSMIDEFSQMKMSSGMMEWKIGKGETVKENTVRTLELCFSYSSGESLMRAVPLLCSSLDEAPERVDHERVNLVGSIIVDFAGVDLDMFDSVWRKLKKVYKLEFAIKIEYGSKQGVLRFSTWVQDREVGVTSIKYTKS